MKNLKHREIEIKKVLYITLYLNLFVAITKMLVGYFSNYLSLTSSGLESLFDGSANVLALIAIYFAAKPPDRDHRYGHHKYETLGSLVIAGLLFFSAIQMGMGKKKAEELSSQILAADASHTYGDFLISIGVLFSIIVSYWGFVWIDFAVSILISGYLFYLALRIIRQNLPDLVDASPEIENGILTQVLTIEGVKNLHKLRARGNKNLLYVDFHLLLEKDLTLEHAHKIGHQAEEMVKKLFCEYADYIDILVHIEPYELRHND